MVLAFPMTIESVDITGLNIGSFAEATPDQRVWFLDDSGKPLAHPNLPDGYALVCQITLADDSKPTWVCNNFGTMHDLYQRFAAGEATGIKWLVGPAAVIQI